jgi:hypothetical protein
MGYRCCNFSENPVAILARIILGKKKQHFDGAKNAPQNPYSQEISTTILQLLAPLKLNQFPKRL